MEYLHIVQIAAANSDGNSKKQIEKLLSWVKEEELALEEGIT